MVRRHRVYPYTLLGYLLRQRFCESNDARLRLRVIEKRLGWSVSLDQTRIDNCRAGLEVRHGGPGDPEHRIDVAFEYRVELLAREIDDRRLRGPHCGIVDEDVQSVQFPDGIGDKPGAEILVPDIAGDRDRLSPFRPDQFHDLPSVGLLNREIVDRDISALTRKGDDGSAANAGIAAGHERLPHGASLLAA